MKLTLKVWRQAGPGVAGAFKTYAASATEHMSFLEMLDVVNEELQGRGEEPIAFVAFAPGARQSLTELESACREQLAPFKRPVEFRILPSLPKGPTGKILRRQIRADQSSA